MELFIAVIIFFVFIFYKTISIFKKDTFENNKTEQYKINPKYVNTDITIEKALENFKIVEFDKR